MRVALAQLADVVDELPHLGVGLVQRYSGLEIGAVGEDEVGLLELEAVIGAEREVVGVGAVRDQLAHLDVVARDPLRDRLQDPVGRDDLRTAGLGLVAASDHREGGYHDE